MAARRFLFTNGVVSDAPEVSSFLETHPGAYTTSRTHNNASCILFWEKHLLRLANSAKILCDSHPELFFKMGKPNTSLSMDSSFWDVTIRSLVNNSMRKVLPVVWDERKSGEELAITALVCGNLEKLRANGNVDTGAISRALDVYLHIGAYVPPVFGVQENGAHLAVVGCGRDVPAAKYSEWARLRKPLEKLRPPLATELLLSNDGDLILEGSVTNFFVVCRMDHHQAEDNCQPDFVNKHYFEVQTAPLRDGILPGVIRELVIEVCLNRGIPLREVAPSWSKSKTWEEAFITSSLRLLQHVETIQVPTSRESLESKTWKHVSWEAKQFTDGPGMITRVIQEDIMKKASLEGFSVSMFA